MKKISRFVLLLFMFAFAHFAQAGPLQGKAFIVDQTGMEIVPGGQDITGEIDVNNSVMNVDPWGPFFGLMVFTNNIEMLSPGTYARDAGTVTVHDGQVGAYMVIDWAVNLIPVFMVWDVSSGGSVFTIVDSDNDGVPGHAMTSGPFVGLTGYYEFTVNGISEPYVKLRIDTNGQNHECINGSADISMIAEAQLFGGGVLESITWELNGEPLGSGTNKTENLVLGNYQVTATALTTTGQSDVATASFSVRDTTRPVARVSIVDEEGVEIISSSEGEYFINIDATDSCDPSPVITSSTATPTSIVSNGDLLKIDKEKGIRLPVTAVRVTVTAKDASGNFSLTNSESSKTITLK